MGQSVSACVQHEADTSRLTKTAAFSLCFSLYKSQVSGFNCIILFYDERLKTFVVFFFFFLIVLIAKKATEHFQKFFLKIKGTCLYFL